MENFVKKNYEYMLQKLGKTGYQFQQEGIIAPTTERRLRNGDPNISDRTINMIVQYYNSHGAELHPHHIELNDFKYKDLSRSTLPKWQNADVEGEYIALYLSRRGTGKPKAMVLTIKETTDKILEVRAIDIVQNPNKATALITKILKKENITQAREAYAAALKDNYSLLRGSRFLHGVASGRGYLLSMHLKDDEGYEMTVSTLLKSYLNTRSSVMEAYSWRGGAAVATVCDREEWPYTMVVGLVERKYWHPDKMQNADIGNALQRMHTYQKKENMLCLQNDIDALWYEVFMDAHRQSEERTVY